MNALGYPLVRHPTWLLWVEWVVSTVCPGSTRWQAIGVEIERRGLAVNERDGGMVDRDE